MPADPVYWRATLHDSFPCFKKPVASITRTASSSARSSRAVRRGQGLRTASSNRSVKMPRKQRAASQQKRRAIKSERRVVPTSAIPPGGADNDYEPDAKSRRTPDTRNSRSSPGFLRRRFIFVQRTIRRKSRRDQFRRSKCVHGDDSFAKPRQVEKPAGRFRLLPVRTKEAFRTLATGVP